MPRRRGLGYIARVTRVISIGVLLWLVASGCDRSTPAPTPPTTAPAGSRDPARQRVTVRVIAPLTPGRPTHVAQSRDGTIWWVQETDEGGDVAFTMGGDAVPRATALTSAAVLDALDPGQATRARGNFHSLAADRDGRLWFYFAGAVGRRSVACVGRFDPRDDAVRIVVSPKQVEEATGMGASLVLARGTILGVAGGDEMWLWVRHSDGARVLRIDPASGTHWRAFEAVTTEAGQPLSLTRPELRAGAGPDGLLLLDPTSVELWRVGPDGRATSLHPLVGLPTTLSSPAADAKGRAFVVASDTPLIPARTDEEAAKILPVRYPALLIIESAKLRARGRDQFDAPEGFALESMRVAELLTEPGANTLIGYDEASGSLLRFGIGGE